MDITNLFTSLISGQATAAGLSIGSSSVKLIELKKTRKGFSFLHFGVVQLPEEAVVNREIMNSIVVSESVKNLTKEMGLKTKNICSGLSGSSMIIKRITVEVPSERELRSQIFWEAEQYLPFDVSDVYMDYHVISRSKTGKTDAILVAVKKQFLDSYMDSITDSGLKPEIVDTDFFALQNVFEANYPAMINNSVAIVDVGASALKVVVVHGGVPVFTKESLIGGKNLTIEIQKNLNLSYVDAEALKVGGGQDKAFPQQVLELVDIMAENISSEIKKSLSFYNASSSGAPINSVLVCGGSSRIRNLSRVIEEIVKVPVQMLNPFNSITYDPNHFTPDYMQSIAPVAAIPVGLALRAGVK